MLLLTGASGAIGHHMLDRWDGDVIALVHQQPVKARLTTAGDVTQPGLGLRGRSLNQVTGILHCAALTEFSASPDILNRVNVRGTRNVLALARKCPRLEKIGVLSTAYVAGRRSGNVLECELDHRSGFVNPYERSKYEMERVLRMNMSDLPIAVYRISTVIGDAESGHVEQFHAIHRALRLYYHALVPMVPGEDYSVIDVISGNYAADCIAYLFSKRFQAGRTYHIVSPEADRISLKHFLELTAEIFGRHSTRWRSGVLTTPPIVPLETFRLLEKTVQLAGNAVLQQVVTAIGLFLPQLSFPKEFDRSNLNRGLQDSRIVPTPLLKYYPAIVRECIESKEVMRRAQPRRV